MTSTSAKHTSVMLAAPNDKGGEAEEGVSVSDQDHSSGQGSSAEGMGSSAEGSMSLRRRRNTERGGAEVEDADEGTDAEMDIEREVTREAEDDEEGTKDMRLAEADDLHASEPEDQGSGKKPARKRVKVEGGENRISRFKGYFEDEVEAAKAYDRAVAEMYGTENETVVFNFDPHTGQRNHRAKRRASGVAAPRPVPLSPLPLLPPLPPVMASYDPLPMPILPAPLEPSSPAPALAPASAPVPPGVIRHKLLMTDQPLPPPSPHPHEEMEGDGDEDSKLDDHAYFSRPQYGRRRDGRRSREEEEDEEEYVPSPVRRPRPRRPALPYTMDMNHRSALTPPQRPPIAHREDMHICPALAAFPPPDPTTPHLITLASLLLDRLSRLTDPEDRARHKRLLKAVAKGGSMVRVTVAAAMEGPFTNWDIQTDEDRREQLLGLLMEWLDEGELDGPPAADVVEGAVAAVPSGAH